MSLNRTNNIKQLAEEELDVLILGGGINGAVAAASLAAKGVKVGLIDKGDFAGATSTFFNDDTKGFPFPCLVCIYGNLSVLVVWAIVHNGT